MLHERRTLPLLRWERPRCSWLTQSTGSKSKIGKSFGPRTKVRYGGFKKIVRDPQEATRTGDRVDLSHIAKFVHLNVSTLSSSLYPYPLVLFPHKLLSTLALPIVSLTLHFSLTITSWRLRLTRSDSACLMEPATLSLRKSRNYWLPFHLVRSSIWHFM